jgi:hypothetical protein
MPFILPFCLSSNKARIPPAHEVLLQEVKEVAVINAPDPFISESPNRFFE